MAERADIDRREARWLSMVAVLDDKGRGDASVVESTTTWLARMCGLSPGEAAGKVALARALAAMPPSGGKPRQAGFCDAHHITHWADGGITALINLILLCRRHHRQATKARSASKRSSSAAHAQRREAARPKRRPPTLGDRPGPSQPRAGNRRGLPRAPKPHHDTEWGQAQTARSWATRPGRPTDTGQPNGLAEGTDTATRQRAGAGPSQHSSVGDVEGVSKGSVELRPLRGVEPADRYGIERVEWDAEHAVA